MRGAFCIGVFVALVAAGAASAEYAVKGYAYGRMVDYPNFPVPDVLDMDGDPATVEFIITNCYNDVCEIGIADGVTGGAAWFFFANWLAPPERFYYVDLGNDGILDALIPKDGEIVCLGWVPGAGASDPIEGNGSRAPASSLPNPTRGGCQISFSVSKSGLVSVTIFDPAGRRIREILSGFLPEGLHSPTWDVRDSGGNRAGSGVCFAKI